MTRTGLYFYCIAEGDIGATLSSPGIDGEGKPVTVIRRGDLSAVVSEAPIVPYRVERKSMLCHERVMEEVLVRTAILPVRFGTVATSATAIERILDLRRAEFATSLALVRGKSELGLKVTWKKEIVFDSILKENEAIAKERATLLQSRVNPTRDHWKLVSIGEKIEAALKAKNEREKRILLSELGKHAHDVKVNDAFLDRMILNASFLVPVQVETEFDETVSRLAQDRADEMVFKYVGRVPPANFVQIVITLDELDAA